MEFNLDNTTKKNETEVGHSEKMANIGNQKKFQETVNLKAHNKVFRQYI